MGVIFAVEMARAVAEDPALANVASPPPPGPMRRDIIFLSLAAARLSTMSAKMTSTARGISSMGPRCATLWARPGWRLPRARWEADRCLGYLEAHIEQGPTLDTMNKKSVS